MKISTCDVINDVIFTVCNNKNSTSFDLRLFQMKIISLNTLEAFEVRSQLISEKSFNLRLQLTSRFPGKPVDAGAED